jgi:hypothetical protein
MGTRYGLDGPGIEYWFGRKFPHPFKPPYRPIRYIGYTVSFPGVKRPGRGVDHPPPSSLHGLLQGEIYLHLYRESFTFCDFYKACFISKTTETRPQIVRLVAISVFCDVKPCSLVRRYQRSGGTSCLHLRSIQSRWFARYVGTRHQLKGSFTSSLCTALS